jgi:hypothetical protein
LRQRHHEAFRLCREVADIERDDGMARSVFGPCEIYYLVWPADDGPKRVRIRISARAFGDYCSDPFGVDIGKAAHALVRHRDLIQQLLSPSPPWFQVSAFAVLGYPTNVSNNVPSTSSDASAAAVVNQAVARGTPHSRELRQAAGTRS